MKSEYFYENDTKASYRFTMAPNNVIFGYKPDELSSNAKIVYLALIRRIGLASQYGWFEPENHRIYVRYPIEQMKKDLGFSGGTIDKALKSLEALGLLEKECRGQGQVNKLYIKYVPDLEIKDSKKQNSRNSNLREPFNHTSKDKIKEKDISNTSNHILSILADENERVEVDECLSYEECLCSVKTQINYDALAERYPIKQNLVDGIVDLMVEVFLSKAKTIHVAKTDFEANMVKAKFRKIDFQGVKYVLDCMAKNTTEIGSIKSYMMTALFNATTTMNMYYQAKVNHDMPQFAG